jgi:hypothetical protein
MTFSYACVSCPECGHLIPFYTLSPGESFVASDPGSLRCRKDHVRTFKAKDVQIIQFSERQRLDRT